ncbi:MAG: hypothetical protein IJS53_01710, partial [Clostridia bacterium]|nr:hypothetical protein [Clostridia bacterium]
EAAPVLVDFAVYDGTVSPDGRSAVVCADLLLRDADGQESALSAVPFVLTNEDGVWKAAASRLAALMGEADE